MIPQDYTFYYTESDSVFRVEYCTVQTAGLWFHRTIPSTTPNRTQCSVQNTVLCKQQDYVSIGLYLLLHQTGLSVPCRILYCANSRTMVPQDYTFYYTESDSVFRVKYCTVQTAGLWFHRTIRTTTPDQLHYFFSAHFAWIRRTYGISHGGMDRLFS